MHRQVGPFATVRPTGLIPSAVLVLGLCSCEAPTDNGENSTETMAPTHESPATAGLQDDLGTLALGSVADSVESRAQSLGTAASISTCQDDSVGPVHVQVRACATGTPQGTNALSCQLDPGYALVGGGAYAQYSGSGALLTATRTMDGRTWQAASKDHQASDPHNLVTYAIGLRLDGVNAATLRSLLYYSTVKTSSPTAHPSVSQPRPQGATSSGALTTTSGNGQLLTRVSMDTNNAWAASKDHYVSSPGTITNIVNFLKGTFGSGTIIEGFGALDFQYKSATPSSVSNGVATSAANVSADWALAGWGGESSYTGYGRMLFRIGPNASGAGCDARSVVVESKDHLVASAGTTTASWTEVRKVPGSHGLCNSGGPLSTGMDPCVASICASNMDPYCCNNYWDDQCVGEVSSICGRSCANYTCSLPSWSDATVNYWNSTAGSPRSIKEQSNCFAYATNTNTGSTTHLCPQPGRASGEKCVGWQTDSANGPALFRECLKRDGLIWNDQSTTCPANMALVAAVLWPQYGGYWDYHFLRRDSGGLWSQKVDGCGGTATNIDKYTSPPSLITDPFATAARGGYTVPVGYFCVCSSSTEGAGHSVIW